MAPIIPSITDIGKGLLSGGLSSIRHDLGLVLRYTLIWFCIAIFDTVSPTSSSLGDEESRT